MPGSLVEPSGEGILEDAGTPIVCADDGYRSQDNDDDELEEVNVELVEE